MKYVIRSGTKRGEGAYLSGTPDDWWWRGADDARRFDTREEADDAVEGLERGESVFAPFRVVRLISRGEAKAKKAWTGQGEADELRAGIEALIAQNVDDVCVIDLGELLDSVAARDSLAIEELKAELEKVTAERQAYALALCEEIVVDAEKSAYDPMERHVIEQMRRGIEARRT